SAKLVENIDDQKQKMPRWSEFGHKGSENGTSDRKRIGKESESGHRTLFRHSVFVKQAWRDLFPFLGPTARAQAGCQAGAASGFLHPNAIAKRPAAAQTFT